MCTTRITLFVNHESMEEKRINWQIDNRNYIVNVGDYVQAGIKEDNKPADYVWFKIIRIKGMKMYGELRNEPYNTTSVKIGTIIAFDRTEIMEHISSK